MGGVAWDLPPPARRKPAAAPAKKKKAQGPGGGGKLKEAQLQRAAWPRPAWDGALKPDGDYRLPPPEAALRARLRAAAVPRRVVAPPPQRGEAAGDDPGDDGDGGEWNPPGLGGGRFSSLLEMRDFVSALRRRWGLPPAARPAGAPPALGRRGLLFGGRGPTDDEDASKRSGEPPATAGRVAELEGAVRRLEAEQRALRSALDAHATATAAALAALQLRFEAPRAAVPAGGVRRAAVATHCAAPWPAPAATRPRGGA